MARVIRCNKPLNDCPGKSQYEAMIAILAILYIKDNQQRKLRHPEKVRKRNGPARVSEILLIEPQ